MVEQYYREKLKEHAFYPYYLKCTDPKQPISLETAYKAFDSNGSTLLQVGWKLDTKIFANISISKNEFK